MKMTARHKELITNFTCMKVRDTNVERPLSHGGFQYLNVVYALLGVATPPLLAVSEDAGKIGKAGCLANKRASG